MMNHLELVKAAGYDTPQGAYLATKMKEAAVTVKQLAELPVVFKAQRLAGIDLYEASGRLLAAHNQPTVNATEAAEMLAAERSIDLRTVKGSGKNGAILKSDVAAVLDEEQKL